MELCGKLSAMAKDGLAYADSKSCLFSIVYNLFSTCGLGHVIAPWQPVNFGALGRTSISGEFCNCQEVRVRTTEEQRLCPKRNEKALSKERTCPFDQ
jgi:hypothetical protein